MIKQYEFISGSSVGGILTGNEIKRQVRLENIEISSFNEKRLNPNSYNLQLDRILLRYDSQILDLKEFNDNEVFEIDEEGFVLYPGTIYLANTVEECWTNKFVPIISGRSSIGRLGLNVHATAGFGDIGWRGVWTLELSCVQPIRIYPYVDICQVYFQTPVGEITEYNGKYQDAKNVQPSFIYREF